MTGNEFCIVAVLNKKPEEPAEIGQKFLRNLDELSAISPYY